MIEIYFYIVVNFPSKQNKYTRGLAERPLGLNRAIKVR